MMRICEMDIGNPKYNTLRLLSSGTKLFITFEFKGYDMRRERDTIFLCWLLLQPTCGARSAQSRLASPSTESQPSEAGTQLTAFFSNLIPRFWCLTSPKYPGLNSYLGLLFWTSLNDTSSPRADEHLR